MADIEFDCPTCATPLVIAVEGAGGVIACPNCSTRITVPGRRRVDISGMVQASGIPPMSPGHRQDCRDYDFGVTLRTRNCTLAYVALGLVCLSLITGGLLLLPGIVCGHIALGQCNRDPQLLGRGCAVAALVIGYIIVGITALMMLGLLGMLAAHGYS